MKLNVKNGLIFSYRQCTCSDQLRGWSSNSAANQLFSCKLSRDGCSDRNGIHAILYGLCPGWILARSTWSYTMWLVAFRYDFKWWINIICRNYSYLSTSFKQQLIYQSNFHFSRLHCMLGFPIHCADDYCRSILFRKNGCKVQSVEDWWKDISYSCSNMGYSSFTIFHQHIRMGAFYR